MAVDVKSDVIIEPVRGDFPPTDTETIFADGALNFSHSPSVVKFYLFRTDPHLEGKSVYRNQVVAQIVMPVAAFVQMQTFFESGLQRLIDLKYVTAADAEATRAGQKPG